MIPTVPMPFYPGFAFLPLNNSAVWQLLNHYKVLSADLPLEARQAIHDECDAMMASATDQPKHYAWSF